jgi:hypothetical protein
MYVMPKALESLWTVSRGKANRNAGRWVTGEALFTAVAMGMVMVSPLLANGGFSKCSRVSHFLEHVSERSPALVRSGAARFVPVYWTELVGMRLIWGDL